MGFKIDLSAVQDSHWDNVDNQTAPKISKSSRSLYGGTSFATSRVKKHQCHSITERMGQVNTRESISGKESSRAGRIDEALASWLKNALTKREHLNNNEQQENVYRLQKSPFVVTSVLADYIQGKIPAPVPKRHQHGVHRKKLTAKKNIRPPIRPKAVLLKKKVQNCVGDDDCEDKGDGKTTTLELVRRRCSTSELSQQQKKIQATNGSQTLRHRHHRCEIPSMTNNNFDLKNHSATPFFTPARFTNAFRQWKKERGIELDQKIFIVCRTVGHILRPVLQKRGWVENPDNESPFFDLKWTASNMNHGKQQLLFFPTQKINHYKNTEFFTRKDFLWDTLNKNCSHVSHLKIEAFVPRTIVLKSKKDINELRMAFLKTQAIAILKFFMISLWIVHPKLIQTQKLELDKATRVEISKLMKLHINRSKVIAAVNVLLRFFKLSAKCLGRAEIEIIESVKLTEIEKFCQISCPHIINDVNLRDIIVEFLKALNPSLFASLSKIADTTNSPSQAFNKLFIEEISGHQKSTNNKDVLLISDTPEIADMPTSELSISLNSLDSHLIKNRNTANHNIKLKAVLLLYLVSCEEKESFVSEGFTNIWILKPARLSRGRDIELYRSFYQIEKKVEAALTYSTNKFVCQKYIERPLIFDKKKFDIRQWILITNWSPLEVWFYKKYYCRFSVDDFQIYQLNNKFCHLTNNAISKQSQFYNATEIPGSMLSSDDVMDRFEMKGKKVSQSVLRQIVDITTCLFKSSAPTMLNESHQSHELFGLDFLVDCAFNVWLLEVNAGPDLSCSTATTTQLVTHCLENVLEVILDCREKQQNMEIGNFELIVREEKKTNL